MYSVESPYLSDSKNQRNQDENAGLLLNRLAFCLFCCAAPKDALNTVNHK